MRKRNCQEPTITPSMSMRWLRGANKVLSSLDVMITTNISRVLYFLKWNIFIFRKALLILFTLDILPLISSVYYVPLYQIRYAKEETTFGCSWMYCMLSGLSNASSSSSSSLAFLILLQIRGHSWRYREIRHGESFANLCVLIV